MKNVFDFHVFKNNLESKIQHPPLKKKGRRLRKNIFYVSILLFSDVPNSHSYQLVALW
jgi:hypothetical protein